MTYGNSFTKRIVDLWNCLPAYVVKSSSVDSFERNLDKFWCNQDVYYNCKATVARTGNKSILTCSNTLCPKKDPQHYWLKKDYQILIIFGTNIPGTSGNPITVQVPTSPSVCACTTLQNQNKYNITFLFKVVRLF